MQGIVDRNKVGNPEGFQVFRDAENRGRSNRRFERRAATKPVRIRGRFDLAY